MLTTIEPNIEHLAALRSEQGGLARRLTEIKRELRDNGVSKNAAHFIPHRVDPERLARRELLIKEQIAIEERLRVVKDHIKELTGVRDTLYDVLRESLTPEQFNQLRTEVRRRSLGHPPTRVILDTSIYREQATESKALAQDLLNRLEASRKYLTAVIQEGCHKWGNAEFLRLISPVNLSIPPLEDLDRLKRIHHLK